MKQEIWRWVKAEDCMRLVNPTAKHNPESAAAEASSRTWCIYYQVLGGAGLQWGGSWTLLKFVKQNAMTASKEIQRQLAAQGVRCEIRRVKR